VLHIVGPATLVLPVHFPLFFYESMFHCHTPGMTVSWACRILTTYIYFLLLCPKVLFIVRHICWNFLKFIIFIFLSNLYSYFPSEVFKIWNFLLFPHLLLL
jgi:hypothetical protein